MRLPRPLPPCACRAVLGMCHVCVRWRGGKARRPETRSLHYGASVGVAGAGSREQTRTNTNKQWPVRGAAWDVGAGGEALSAPSPVPIQSTIVEPLLACKHTQSTPRLQSPALSLLNGPMGCVHSTDLNMCMSRSGVMLSVPKTELSVFFCANATVDGSIRSYRRQRADH